jgi:TRAP-type C4-dicarboxylate transport system substrate-binding protein
VSEKLPLSGIVELPALFQSSCVGTAAFWSAAGEGGILATSEYGPQKVRVLFGAMLAPYQLLMREVPIENLDQLKGAKIRTGGGTQDILINKLGAVPVRIPGPEIYESLSRGTADGVILPLASVFSYDLQKLLKYSTLSSGFGTTVTAYMIGEDRWNQLPADVQQIMLETGREASMALCAYIDDQTEKLVGRLEEAGVSIVSLPEAEQARMDAILSQTAGEWAVNLDGRGLPATPLLDAMVAAASH